MLKNADGVNSYGSSGLTMSGVNALQGNPIVLANSSGNIFITYHDKTASGTGRLVGNYMRANTDFLSWGYYGKTLHQDDEFGLGKYTLSLDNTGGFFTTWEDNSNGFSLVAQRFNQYGNSSWSGGNHSFSLLGLSNDGEITLNVDQNDDLIVSWISSFGTNEGEPMIQKMDHNGYMGDNQVELLSIDDNPNDQGGEAIVSWQGSPLDVADNPVIANYSLWIMGGEKSGNTHSLQLPEEVQIKDQEIAELLKMQEADVIAMRTSGWTFTGQVPAMLSLEYSALCPTFGDSTATGITYTNFKVVAHHQTPGIFWESDEMQGYSIDNFAPGAPLNLAGEGIDIGADLVWEASGHHDEDLAEYRIYRGAETGFIMDETTLLGASQTTGFLDATATGTMYYRVTAADVHGNEGQASAEVMVNLTVSAVDAMPLVFKHHGNYPNPFNPMTQISFDLPDAALVRVSVYDTSGRLISTLVNESMGAGNHQVRWNGLDLHGRSVSSGVYFSRIDAGEYTATSRMTLVR